MSSFPTQARAVIVGGGIIGCSVAYHLARLGWTDTVLLERAKLTSGSTFHAAGLVGQLRSNANVTRMLTDSVALYESLEAITGLATGWKRSGCLRLACTAERMTESDDGICWSPMMASNSGPKSALPACFSAARTIACASRRPSVALSTRLSIATGRGRYGCV